MSKLRRALATTVAAAAVTAPLLVAVNTSADAAGTTQHKTRSATVSAPFRWADVGPGWTLVTTQAAKGKDQLVLVSPQGKSFPQGTVARGARVLDFGFTSALVATPAANGGTTVTEINFATNERQFMGEGLVESATFTGDGLIVIKYEGSDAQSYQGKYRNTPYSGTSDATRVVVSADGQTLYSNDKAGRITVYDINSPTPIKTVKVPRGSTNCQASDVYGKDVTYVCSGAVSQVYAVNRAGKVTPLTSSFPEPVIGWVGANLTTAGTVYWDADGEGSPTAQVKGTGGALRPVAGAAAPNQAVGVAADHIYVLSGATSHLTGKQTKLVSITLAGRSAVLLDVTAAKWTITSAVVQN